MNFIILPCAFKLFGSNGKIMCFCYQMKKIELCALRRSMKKETKLTKTGIVYILTNKMKTESFEFDIPQKHGN